MKAMLEFALFTGNELSGVKELNAKKMLNVKLTIGLGENKL